MSWNDGYYDDPRNPHDPRDYAFEVRCEGCGEVRLNTDPELSCCSCGSTTQSYDGGAARDWNERVNRGWR